MVSQKNSLAPRVSNFPVSSFALATGLILTGLVSALSVMASEAGTRATAREAISERENIRAEIRFNREKERSIAMNQENKTQTGTTQNSHTQNTETQKNSK